MTIVQVKIKNKTVMKVCLHLNTFKLGPSIRMSYDVTSAQRFKSNQAHFEALTLNGVFYFEINRLLYDTPVYIFLPFPLLLRATPQMLLKRLPDVLSAFRPGAISSRGHVGS